MRSALTYLASRRGMKEAEFITMAITKAFFSSGPKDSFQENLLMVWLNQEDHSIFEWAKNNKFFLLNERRITSLLYSAILLSSSKSLVKKVG